MLRSPHAAPVGARVRVVSVAGRVVGEAFHRGVERLQAHGYAVDVDESLLDRGHAYLAAPASERAEALLAAFVDPSVDVVWCARGGYGAMHLLDRLDFERLAETRKPFVGFSDITALHLALNGAGLTTFHGPVVTALGSTAEVETNRVLERLSGLLGGVSGVNVELRGEGVAPGRASGRLFGGNLSLLAACLPVSSLAPPVGSILLLEDINEPLYRLDRLVTGLCLSGLLDGVAGFAVGSFEGCGRGPGGPSQAARLVAEGLVRLGKPIVGRLPIGHRTADVPVALGATVELDGDAGELRWLAEELVGA